MKMATSLSSDRCEGERPLLLMEALALVRASEQCNMLDRTCVIIAFQNLGYESQADWLEQHPDSYGEILMYEFSQWLQDHPRPRRESLAQQVARETGLEVIEE